MYSNFLLFFKKYIIPKKIFDFFQPAYHYTLALSAAIFYRFPSRKIRVIAVTGTKGKSSTVEIISAILEEAGYTTALSNTIRTKIANTSTENKFKMSMPGRFFVQRVIRRAVNAGCDVIILEMTSQGSLQYRHRFIDLDTFVLTNISPEHIEAHGSFEKYVAAKVAIAKAMNTSRKRPRTIITNADDTLSSRFVVDLIESHKSYGIADAEPYTIGANGIDFTLTSKTGDKIKIHSPLSGLFNLYNILAAISAARTMSNVTEEIITRAVSKFHGIRGRVEYVWPTEISSEQVRPFDVVVDYAHTTDSLEKFYSIFKDCEKVCVLGGTGGGRDAWKRSEMGRIADENCDHVILTNEDPYDEDPMVIIEDVKKGAPDATVILDRREAIRHAITLANTYAHTKITGAAPRKKNFVLITGKGTDPYIMGPNGSKIPWDDAQVAREEIKKVLSV